MREQWKKSKIGEFAEVKGGKRLPKGKQLISEPNAHPYMNSRFGKVEVFAIKY